MMTPFHTDLMTYSTPAAPTAHERQALRLHRHAHHAMVSAVIEKILSYRSQFQVLAKRPRANAPS